MRWCFMVWNLNQGSPFISLYEQAFYTLFVRVSNDKEFRNDGLKHFASKQLLFYTSISSPSMFLCPLNLIDSEGNRLWEKYFLAVMMGYATEAFFKLPWGGKKVRAAYAILHNLKKKKSGNLKVSQHKFWLWFCYVYVNRSSCCLLVANVI